MLGKGLNLGHVSQQSIVILLRTLFSEHVLAHFLYMSQEIGLNFLAGKAAVYYDIDGGIGMPVVLFVELKQMLSNAVNSQRLVTAHAESIQWGYHEQFVELLHSALIVVAAQDVLLVDGVHLCCDR